MLTQSVRRSLTAALLAIVLIGLTAITGHASTAVQDNYLRGRKLGRDVWTNDYLDRLRDQRRERRVFQEELRRDRQALMRERRETLRLRSEGLRQLKRQEQTELRQRRLIEKESLKPSLRSRLWRRR
jgi:hypothetical protein